MTVHLVIPTEDCPRSTMLPKRDLQVRLDEAEALMKAPSSTEDPSSSDSIDSVEEPIMKEECSPVSVPRPKIKYEDPIRPQDPCPKIRCKDPFPSRPRSIWPQENDGESVARSLGGGQPEIHSQDLFTRSKDWAMARMAETGHQGRFIQFRPNGFNYGHERLAKQGCPKGEKSCTLQTELRMSPYHPRNH